MNKYRAEIYQDGWHDLRKIAIGALIGVVYTSLVLWGVSFL